MGKTSNTVKDRWNRQNYEEIKVRLPRGRKSAVEVHARNRGLSVNGLVGELLRTDMNMTEEEWKRKPDDE